MTYTYKMDLKTTLASAVESFHITTQNNIRFWAPYLVNKNYTQSSNVPRGLGKASPEEIKKSAQYITELFPNASAEIIRKKLTDGSLPNTEFNFKGIDCSGLVFYVMDEVYQKLLGKELMDDLSVPKDNVLNGAFNFEEWKAAYTLTEEEAANLPEDVPVSWVVEKFKRKPVNLCRVAGLISNFSSRTIALTEMQPGDLLDLTGRGEYKFHIAIVCSVEADTVTVVHSTRNNEDDPGGIRFEKLPFNKETIFTEHMLNPCDFNSARRLRSL